MNAMRVQNIKTGTWRYFINGRRVSSITYEWRVGMATSTDCLLTKISATHIRHFTSLRGIA